jgi:hypothetical protein
MANGGRCQPARARSVIPLRLSILSTYGGCCHYADSEVNQAAKLIFSESPSAIRHPPSDGLRQERAGCVRTFTAK